METVYKSYPQISGSNFDKLRVQFNKAIPGVISATYLATVLNISEVSAKGVYLPTLRQIGLVDRECKTNIEFAKKMRDDSMYPKLCEDLVQKLYPQELRDIFTDKNADRTALKGWFMNHTGTGESAAEKMAVFYLKLVEANPEIKASNKEKVQKQAGNPLAKNQKGVSIAKRLEVPTPKPIVNEDHLPRESKTPLYQNRNNSPELNINVQIHISSDASPDQIKCIFENMAKYLYKS